MKIENHSKDDHENLSPSYRNIGKNNDILSVSKIEYEHFFFKGANASGDIWFQIPQRVVVKMK